MLKNICLAIVLVMMLSACAFAQAKPLDPAKDYAIGPFKPGDAWNLQLAEKYFGKPLDAWKTKLRLDLVHFDKNNGIIAEPVDAEPGTVGVDYIKFKSASFVVINNKIRLITNTDKKLQTVRGIGVGDSLEKMRKIYPVSSSSVVMDEAYADTALTGKKMTGKFDDFLPDLLAGKNSPEFYICFRNQSGGQDRKLFVFVDKKTGTVSGLALNSLDLPAAPPKIAASSPAAKPTPKAQPSAKPTPTAKTTPAVKPILKPNRPQKPSQLPKQRPQPSPSPAIL